MVHPAIQNPGTRRVVAAAVVALGIVGAIPFFIATTFIGDDHLFLAFSRYVPNPLVAFIRDQHGGEFYRPLPMQLWWVLGRLGGESTVPFAVLAWLLHTTVAVETGMLVLGVRGDSRKALIAATLFFVAPFVREAAYWYSASTDLLASVLGLGAVLALSGRRPLLGMLLFGGACWSKESAIVVPTLAVLILRVREPQTRWSVITKRVAVTIPVMLVYLASRTIVLHGIGGSGDEATTFGGKCLQIGAGLIHAGPAADLLSDPLVLTLGIATWVALLVGTARLARSEVCPPFPWAPLAWIVLAILPLLAAPWIVGARYFYLAAIGIAWLAAELLAPTSIVVTVGVFAALAGFDVAQTVVRRTDVISYEARLSAARRAVAAGLDDGHTTFHIASGIKDLDLAVKGDPHLSRRDSFVVLGDVPASFVALPGNRARDFDFLLARPHLPPSGAYLFGSRRIVGLARRGDDPTLDEVVQRLPGIRFVRLRLGPRGRVVYRDVTDAMLNSDTE